MRKINLQVVVSAQDKASRVLTKFGKNVEKMRAGLNKYRGAILAGTAALGGMVYMAKKAIDAFGVQERAEARLTAGLKNVDGMTQRHIDSLITYAGELQKITTFSDEQTISAMGMLSTFQLNDKAIKTLIPRVLDMAASLEKATGTAQDLETIAIAVGKSMTTGIGALSRYGVVIGEEAKAAFDAAATPMEKVNIIAQELDKNFKGIAEEVAGTTTGTIKQLENTIGDLQETMGGAVAEALSPWIIKLKAITEDEVKMRQITEGITIAVDTFVISLQNLKKIFDVIVDVVSEPIARFIEMKDAIEGLIKGTRSLRTSLGGIMRFFGGISPINLLPGFQHGGIVPGRKGQPVPAVLHGGEEVIPAHRAGRGITVNITGGTFLSEDAAEKMGDLIIEKLKQQIRF